MTIEQAMGIAKNAQSSARDAHLTANEALTIAKIMEARHNEHEKTCGERYEAIVKTNTDNGVIFQGIHEKIEGVNKKLFNGLVFLVIGMFGIIGTLLGVIFYGKLI